MNPRDITPASQASGRGHLSSPLRGFPHLASRHDKVPGLPTGSPVPCIAYLASHPPAAYDCLGTIFWYDTSNPRMLGRTISHYTVLERLGGGGMGVVYKARDNRLDRFVALKFLSSELSADEIYKKRFIHEAKAASALDHPNIGTIYEIDETADGNLFIAMAYYEGVTLKTKLQEGNVSITIQTRNSRNSPKILSKSLPWFLCIP